MLSPGAITRIPLPNQANALFAKQSLALFYPAKVGKIQNRDLPDFLTKIKN